MPETPDFEQIARRLLEDLPDAFLTREEYKRRYLAQVNCECGTDEALARGETSFARLDVLCPKHD